MQERLIAIYEMGEISVLDMLLSSNGIVDLVSNYYLATELANYDTELLDEIERKKNEIQAMKDSLEENNKKIETNKKNVEQTSKALKDAKQQKDERVAETKWGRKNNSSRIRTIWKMTKEQFKQN